MCHASYAIWKGKSCIAKEFDTMWESFFYELFENVHMFCLITSLRNHEVLKYGRQKCFDPLEKFVILI